MAISLSDNLAIGTAAAADVRYGVWSGSTIAAAIVQANGGIGTGLRFAGLTVGILDTNSTTNPTGYVVEYWYQLISGTLTLVEKTSGGTVGGTGTVNAIPYWSATDTLSDSAASHFNSKRVDVKSNLHLLGQGGDLGAKGYLRFESGDQVNHVGFYGPGNGLDSDSYDLFLPTTLPSVTNQILESNASGSLSWIPTPTGGSGTVTGTGTPNTLTKWSTGGTGIEDSEISDSGTVVKIGDSVNGETLYINTDTRSVGFRTPAPTASAFDVNGTMRVRNEINVGATNEQSLFVEGPGASGTPAPYYVKMGSYGQGLITGSPAVANQGGQNLRRSAAFGNAGKIVDNYIYDTFEITLDALSNLGTLTTNGGLMLIDPGADHIVLLADMWFYRQINNNSNPGTWDPNTDIVIGPKNTVNYPDPNNQYFRITAEFLNGVSNKFANPDESFKGSQLYQGNLNAGPLTSRSSASLPYGAWQVGNAANQAPKGNKVYMTLTTPSTPGFPGESNNTRYFLGLKYRLLNIQYGVVNNSNLVRISGPNENYIWELCDNTNCASRAMQQTVILPQTGAGSGTFLILSGLDGETCCYYRNGTTTDPVTPGFSYFASWAGDCDNLPEACSDAPEAQTNKYVKCADAKSEPDCTSMDEEVYINYNVNNPATAVIEDTANSWKCCYIKNDGIFNNTPTTNHQITGVEFNDCDDMPFFCTAEPASLRDIYNQCDGNTSNICNDKMDQVVYITSIPSNPQYAIIEQSPNGEQCCYVKASTSLTAATPNYTIASSMDGDCNSLPIFC